LLLLHGQVPHEPGMATVLGQHCGLLRAGKQPEPAHGKNVTATTDNLPKGQKWRSRPRLKPGIPAPQN
jgi:hypothetical protein